MSVKIPLLPRLSDYPLHYADCDPEREAAVLGDYRLSFSGFAEQIDLCAKALLASGVGEGDRVATLSNPHPSALILFMACARIGAIWVGLNTRSQYDELAYIISDAQPRLLFAISAFESRSYQQDLQRLDSEFGCLESVFLLDRHNAGPDQCFADYGLFLTLGKDVSEEQLSQASAEADGDKPALIVYTSGSTGQPKGALLSHSNIIHSALTQYQCWHPEPLRILNNMPINHLGGAVQVAAYAIVCGGTNILMERFQPQTILAEIEANQITVVHQTSTMYQMILDQSNPEDYDLSNLELLIWSGSACPRDLLSQLKKLCPNLSTSYGQTECGAEVLYVPVGAYEEVLATTVGKPPDSLQVRLVDDKDNLVTDGEAGEIQVKGPTMMLGYWQNPEATQEAFTEDGWLKTGDLAEKTGEGNFKIVGRLKEMYKSGGYNIYPREIEILLESHPAVAIAAVVSVPDPLYSEVGYAFILLEEQQQASEQALKDFCREKLANYKIPKRFILRDSLPMLPIGKVDKVALKQEAMPLKATR
jgi:acyl-CoA synthetase (AMP-forming)/AMP-acid ligase II